MTIKPMREPEKVKCDRCKKKTMYFYRIADTRTHNKMTFCPGCGESFTKWLGFKPEAFKELPNE